MLRISINNEQVVSDKDFTINLEMLNTPSVILNNVYPLSWEDSKDYVSNFYYPPDYSKCKIYDETYYPASDGTTVEDTSINADVNTEYNWDYQLKGNIEQNGTPTPSDPQEVKTVTGYNEIDVVGKNLFDKDNANILNAYFNSSTPTITSDSSERIVYIPCISNTTYTISKNVSNRFVVGYTSSLPTNGVSVAGVIQNYTASSITITTGANAKYLVVFCWIATDTLTINEVLATIQIEKNSTATDYEVYTGNKYEINLGKNWFNLNYSTENLGINVNLSGSKIILNGTTSSNGNIINLNNINFPIKKGTYTISSKILDGSFTAGTRDVAIYIRTVNNSTGLMTLSKGNNYTNTQTVTLENDEDIYVQIYTNGAGFIFDNYTIGIQLERGSQATDYAPFMSNTNLFTGVVEENNKVLASDGAYNSQGGYAIYERIPVDSNTDYKLNFKYTGTADHVVRVGLYDENDTFIERLITSYSNYTFNTGNAKYIRLSYAYNVDTDVEILDTRIATYPIELPNGNYIHKINDKWYVHKIWEKIILDGSESWNYNSPNGNLYINGTNYLKLSDGGVCYSSHFKGTANGGSQDTNGNMWIGNSVFLVCRDTTRFTSANDFKSWLSTNNVTVWYKLATEVDVEITNDDLIEQLEAVNLLNGINNISTYGVTLDPIMKLHYNYHDEYTTEDLYFCGVVKNTGNISLNPREPHYCSLQILDFKTFLSEGKTLDFVIANKTVTEAISQVTNAISDYGFVVGNINILNPNDVIGAYSTKDKTAYDVFNYIADITQSRWTTRMIDENTVAIDFYDPTLMIKGTEIDYTQEWWKEHNIIDMTYNYGTYDYRNRQIITSDEVYADISTTETIIANGYQNQYNTQQKIGDILSVTIDGQSVSYATNFEKELGIVADVYYTVNNQYIETDEILTAGTVIAIEYVGIVQGRQIISNSDEISRINEQINRNGIISRYEDRNDATTSDELQAIGNSYIKYKGIPEIKLKVQTTENIWNIGQTVQFNAPIEELITDYMVKSKQINYIATQDLIFYIYELTSSFNSEQEINYFDNQRAKANGNIEGDYISRNIDIEESVNVIFYDTEISEST